MNRIPVLLAVLLASVTVTAETLSPPEQRMADWIDEHADDAVALLKETVDIPSGSLSLDGVR